MGSEGPREQEVMCEKRRRSVPCVRTDEQKHQTYAARNEYYVLIELYGSGQLWTNEALGLSEMQGSDTLCCTRGSKSACRSLKVSPQRTTSAVTSIHRTFDVSLNYDHCCFNLNS